MKRHVTLKHVEHKTPVRNLIEDMLDRLEEQTKSIDHGSVSAHVAIEQNVPRALFSISLTCHVPKKALVAHEEGHDAAATIRAGFSEIARQVEKYRDKHHAACQSRETINERLEPAVPDTDDEE